MHIGVVVLVIMPERIEDRARFLRRRRIVKIDQRLAVHLVRPRIGKSWRTAFQSTEAREISCTT